MVLPKGYTPELVETWGMDKGLPQANVTAVLQTRDSYLWAGTDGGLARFDGMKFTTFRTTNTPGMTNHAVTELFEDRAGTLWIGTEGGLIRYRNLAFEPVGLEGRAILAMCEGADGSLWVGSDAGVHRLKDGTITHLEDPALPRTAAQALLADSGGRVWIGFSQWPGLVCFDGQRFEVVSHGDAVRAEVLAIVEEPRGTLWFGTGNGLVRRSGSQFARFGTEDGLAGRRVSDLYADGNGGVWVATSGLQRITGGDLGSITTVRLMAARVFQGLWRDREGNLWAGTSGDGLICVRTAPFQLIPLNARTVANGFRTVMQDREGVLWLAQGSLGYTRIASDSDVTRTLPDVDGRIGDVLAVLAPNDGSLWVGGRDTLRVTRGTATQVFPEYAGARVFFEDRRGGIWLGRQNGGLVRWHDGVFSTVALPDKVARCTPSSVAETSTGEIWIGTWNHGVIRLRGTEITIFDRDAGLPTSELRCVFVDRTDRVWVGTRGRGLGMFENGQWILPDWTSELIDQQIISIVEDAGDRMWLAAPRGVFKVPRAELVSTMLGRLAPTRLNVVNATEGLRQELADLACFPAACRTRDGLLWFATRRGILRIDPAGSSSSLLPPTVHIERVLVNGERHNAVREIVLPPDTPGLAIEYTGLSFSAPGHVRFQYRMEGVDEKWIAADDRRMAHYAKLPPGQYRFQVKASNAAGVWSERAAALTIVQQGWWYQSPWVWWLAGFTVVAGVAGGYRWRSAAHAAERRRLERGIAERTRELQIAKEHAEASTRAKAEFLESISHEIRNPLNGIIGLVAMLREAPLDARERELAQSLGACAKGLVRVFDEVLNFSRLEHGYVPLREKPFKLGVVLDEVAALFRVMARQRGSEIVVRREGAVPDLWIGDAEKISSILGNFVSNALKYAPGAPIELLVQCDAVDEFGADVTFNVTDRGPGIPAEEQERIFEKFVRGSTARNQRTPGTGLGLATCRALAELMGGHVAVESPAISSRSGATFFLRLRLKRDRNPTTVIDLPAPAPVPAGRALIVEDQAYNQIVVRRIAERLGYVTDVTHDGEEALGRLARQTYAVIFVDWELPGMHGDAFARNVRQMPGGAEPIVIATTAHDSEEIRRQCFASGMDGFALKPFETETIARLLADARARRGAPAQHDTARLDTRVFRFVGYDDPEQAGQAARLYLDILEQEVALLEGAITQRDTAGAAAAAHRIKSHAGLVDAAELRETADRMQREARTAPAVTLAELHVDLVRHAGLLRERLKSWRDEDAGA